MIGQRIKRFREDRKITQDVVAEKLGITQTAYSKIENNQSKLSVERLKEIAKILDVPEDELLNTEANVFNFTNNKTANGYAIYQGDTSQLIETVEILKAELNQLRLEREKFLAIISQLSSNQK